LNHSAAFETPGLCACTRAWSAPRPHHLFGRKLFYC